MEVSRKQQPKVGKVHEHSRTDIVFQVIVVLAIVMLTVTAFLSLQSAARAIASVWPMNSLKR